MISPGLNAEMVQWRQGFHQIPELEFDLPKTSARVAEMLETFGLQVHRNIGQSGVVGVLQKGNGGRTIGIRADMDALPIHEKTGLPYASGIDGQMHACGHDGHTTMLLGAAKMLADMSGLTGRIVFLFQPNEEHGQGAKAMIADGIFDRFEVDAVWGMHNIPGMPVGQFATRAGPITASEALFEIQINARGGHAALPHMGADAITIGAQIVGALQTIVARKLDPAQNGVVSVTEFTTDGKRNVLPGQAILSGDARALTPEVNHKIEVALRRIVAGVCAAHDVTAAVTYNTIFQPTLNAPDLVALSAVAAQTLGTDMDTACPPKLFSEDFAEMDATVPGCFVLMGNGTMGANARPLHSADYDFNDAALAHGAGFWVALAQAALRDV